MQTITLKIKQIVYFGVILVVIWYNKYSKNCHKNLTPIRIFDSLHLVPLTDSTRFRVYQNTRTQNFCHFQKHAVHRLLLDFLQTDLHKT